jgi:hypothetical protein
MKQFGGSIGRRATTRALLRPLPTPAGSPDAVRPFDHGAAVVAARYSVRAAITETMNV